MMAFTATDQDFGHFTAQNDKCRKVKFTVNLFSRLTVDICQFFGLLFFG